MTKRKIKFVQHVPGFVSGCDPEIFTVNTVAELKRKLKSHLCENEVFARDEEGNHIMSSSTVKKNWWVLGYVTGINLKKYLPYYENTYKLSGKIAVVKFKNKKDNWLDHDSKTNYIVEDTSGSDYSLFSLKSLSSGAWFEKNSVKFVRYATKKELDTINKITEGK